MWRLRSPLIPLAAIVLLACAASAESSRKLTTDSDHGLVLASELEATPPAVPPYAPPPFDFCTLNKFIPLPTAWRGSQGYVITSTQESADAYCQALGYLKAGSLRQQPRWYTNLEATEPQVDLSKPSQPSCPDLHPGCMWITAVECVAIGGKPCPFDAYGNIGTGNVGYSNFGSWNRGNGNAGSSNIGDNNYGDGVYNVSKVVGYMYPSASPTPTYFINTANPGIDLQGIGLLGHNLLQIFSSNTASKAYMGFKFCLRLEGYYIDQATLSDVQAALQMSLNQGSSYDKVNIGVNAIPFNYYIPPQAANGGRRLLSGFPFPSVRNFSATLNPTGSSTEEELRKAVEQLPLFFRAGFYFIDKFNPFIGQSFTLTECKTGQRLSYLTYRPIVPNPSCQIDVCFASGGKPILWVNQTALLRSVVASVSHNPPYFVTDKGKLAVVRAGNSATIVVPATNQSMAAASLDFNPTILAARPSARSDVLSTGIIKCQEILTQIGGSWPKRIVMLTSTNPRAADRPTLNQAAAAAKAAGIKIAAVGVGNNIRLGMLRSVASNRNMAVRVKDEDFNDGQWQAKIDTNVVSGICTVPMAK